MLKSSHCFWYICIIEYITLNIIFYLQNNTALSFVVVISVLVTAGSTLEMDKTFKVMSKKMFKVLQRHNNVDLSNYMTDEPPSSNIAAASTSPDLTSNVENATLPIATNKRTLDASSIMCDTFIHWRDLGNRHYPRFLKENVCTSEAHSCYNNFYTCRPVMYAVTVMTDRDPLQDDVDVRLPTSLRTNWKFVSYNITVDCKCSE